MSEVERFTNPDFKKYVTAKHAADLLWFDQFMDARGISFEEYGYERLYGNDLDRYNEIRHSKDYVVRYRPDRKLRIGPGYLAEIKAKYGFLAAIGLMINAQRRLKTFYVVQRQLAAFAEDLVDRQREFFVCLRFYNKKQGYKDIEPELLETFEGLGAPERSSDDIGWVEEYGRKFYRSGDPCVLLRADAPLEDLRAFLDRLEKQG